MGREANIATQLRMIAAVNAGELEVLNEVFTLDCNDHDPAPDQAQGAAGYIKFFQEFRGAFPDLHVQIERMVVGDTDIALAVCVTGTHKGLLGKHSPTGKKIKVRGLQIAEFTADGRIRDRWGSSDQFGMLQQLGLVGLD